MTNRTLTTEQLLRHFIGFDRLAANAASFPPHNIERIDEDRYRLTLAVAGFSRDEIEIYLHQGTLTISGRKAQIDFANITMIHQGIAFRDWDRQFHLGEYVEVTGARTEDGLLIIDLERKIPEEQKPKQIPIG